MCLGGHLFRIPQLIEVELILEGFLRTFGWDSVSPLEKQIHLSFLDRFHCFHQK